MSQQKRPYLFEADLNIGDMVLHVADEDEVRGRVAWIVFDSQGARYAIRWADSGRDDAGSLTTYPADELLCTVAAFDEPEPFEADDEEWNDAA